MINTNDGYYYAEGARDIIAGKTENTNEFLSFNSGPDEQESKKEIIADDNNQRRCRYSVREGGQPVEKMWWGKEQVDKWFKSKGHDFSDSKAEEWESEEDVASAHDDPHQRDGGKIEEERGKCHPMKSSGHYGQYSQLSG